MKTLWRILRTLGLLILSLANCDAQVKTNSFYFSQTFNGSSYLTYVRVYESPGVVGLATFTNNVATFVTRTVSLTNTVIATLDYFFQDPDAAPAQEVPEFIPYIPPPLTPEQQLMVSNKIWLRIHPAIVAMPKSGALQKVNLVTKPPMP